MAMPSLDRTLHGDLHSPHKLLLATALIELAAGLALLCVPGVVIRFLLGVGAAAPEALIVGRIGGAGLLALGVACYLARNASGTASQRGILSGMLLYNGAACLVLGLTGALTPLQGIALWPAAVLHTVMTAWCLAALLR
jgi:hypothetical protein